MILAVHGIWNLRAGRAPDEAARDLAAEWRVRLGAGFRDAGLPDVPVPDLAAAYYADLLADGAQGDDDLESLSPAEQLMAADWLRHLGVPAEEAQGPLTVPLRQALDWLARRRSTGPQALARVMTAVLREVYTYLSRPGVRERARRRVVDAVEAHRPAVVVAHSLGSVVTYEALHLVDHPVELLVTVGSPLGLPGAVFPALDPEPVNGRGIRPPHVGRWVNIADPGDLVAVPARLGDRFDVDLHAEAYVGAVDFHTLGGYLSCGLTAAAIAPYLAPASVPE